MERHLKQLELKPDDEAWIVVDKDNWTDEQLALLHRWSQSKENYHLALSNPKFEYWLLLHFEDGDGIASAYECDKRLKRYIQNYGTRYNFGNITQGNINDAVHRGKKRDSPPCKDWPRSSGATTVYRLVEKIVTGRQKKR